MESYFFIPGTRLHKVNDILKINVSEVIVDLEDAVKFSERKQILAQLLENTDFSRFNVRIPLYNNENKLDSYYLDNLYSAGFRKFVFPKIQKNSDFEQLISNNNYPEIQLILLVETPRLFLEAKDLLLKHESFFVGIGLGSHDFMGEVGGVHTIQNLEYLRQHLLYLARMINIKAIDIASMELKDSSFLQEEIIDGVHKGYDAKFFIHPWQIEVFHSISIYSEQEIKWALQIQQELNKVTDKTEFNPIVLEGQVIERPHLYRAQKILKYYESKSFR